MVGPPFLFCLYYTTDRGECKGTVWRLPRAAGGIKSQFGWKKKGPSGADPGLDLLDGGGGGGRITRRRLSATRG